MGRLTTIADVEAREAGLVQEATEEQPAVQPQPVEEAPAEPILKEKPEKQPRQLTASQKEEAFHGINVKQKRSAGQVGLTAAAVVVVLAAAAYIVNYWLGIF